MDGKRMDMERYKPSKIRGGICDNVGNYEAFNEK